MFGAALREPTHICDPDPKELIRKFMEELKRRGRNICALVRREFMPKDTHLITQKRPRAMTQWCNQVPVLGFNCGHYDLNLIKEHFAELLADTTSKVQVAKKSEHHDVYEDRLFSLLRHHQLSRARDEL